MWGDTTHTHARAHACTQAHSVYQDRKQITQMTDQNMDSTKVQVNKPMGFIGVTYRKTGEGLVTGAETI